MTILVTGGNGQLGSELRLASAKSSHCYIFTDIEELDITSAESVEDFLSENHINIVINCAAYTAVDIAEEQEEMAEKINHTAVATLANACARHNALLIHISTDYIFSGETTLPYNEEDTPAPCNTYGRTKFAGERAITESECNYIILRTSWLYSEFGRNFVKSIRQLSATKSSIKVVADQHGTPTYAADLAGAIVEIIESGQHSKYGIYHYSNLGECSWWDFAVEIADRSGNSECKVLPCATADYPTKAKRPRYSVLDKDKFIKTFGIAIPQWQSSLAECIKQLNK